MRGKDTLFKHTKESRVAAVQEETQNKKCVS